MKEEFFATRHATPERNKTATDPASKEYPDLTVGGVEQAKEKARTEVLKLIPDAPPGAVILIGATSDQPRTKQTAKIYGDELARLQSEKADETLLVLTKDEIEKLGNAPAQEHGLEKKGFAAIAQAVRSIEKVIRENPEKKVVVDYPLMVRELAYKYNNRWTTTDGKKTSYFTEILKKHGNNHEEAGKDWIANQGRLELSDGRVLHGPTPEDVAREYLHGVKRLKDFAQKYTGGRPLIVGEVGHQWDIDALVTYLGSGGTVDRETFEEITGGTIAGETEMTEFKIGSNTIEVKYRGKTFTVVE